MATPLPETGSTQNQGGGLLDYIVKGIQGGLQNIQSNPTVQNIEKNISNYSPGQDIINAIPGGGGKFVNSVLKNTGHQMPTIGQIGQNYAQENQDLSSNDPRKKFNALVKGGGLIMGDNMTPGAGFTEDSQSAIKSQIPETSTTEYPYTKSAGIMGKNFQGQNQTVRQIRLTPSISGARQISDIHDAMDRLGFQGSAEQQYGQLEPKMQELNDWIQNDSSLAKNPKTISIDDVKSSLLNEVKKQFPVGGPDTVMARQAINQYVNDIYDAAVPAKPLGPNTPRGAFDQNSAINTTDVSPSTNTGTENPNRIVIPKQVATDTANNDFQLHALKDELNKNENTINSIYQTGSNANGRLYERDLPGLLNKNEELRNKLESLTSQKSTMNQGGDISLPNTQANTPKYAVENPTSPYNPETANNNVVPDKISTPNIYKMKVIGNKATGNIFKKLDNGTPLNDLEKVTLAGRNAWDNIISSAHPDVKQATMDMSRLYDAAPSLEKAMYNTPPPSQPLNAILPKAAQVFIPPIAQTGINKLLTNPTALKVGGVLAGAGALAGGGYLLGKRGEQTSAQVPSQTTGTGQAQSPTSIPQNPTNNYLHTSDIPQTPNDVKTDQNGNYSVVSPNNIIGTDGKAIALGGEDALQQLNQIEGQMNQMRALKTDNTPQFAQLQTQYDLLQQKQQIVQQAQTAYSSYSQLTNLVADAKQRLANAPGDLLVNTSFQKLSTAFDGKYKQLATDLQTIDKINQSMGILQSSLFNQQTTQVALAGLDQVGRQTTYKYYNDYINPLLGNVGQNSLTSGKPIQPSPYQMPVPSTQKPNTAGWGLDSSNGGTQMPQIPSVQQMQQIGASYANQ